MAYTYPTKADIAPVGVSQVRVFYGPVNLVITETTSGSDTAVTDNFPQKLTEEQLFGAVIAVDDGTNVKKFIADEVYTASGKVYFKLGTNAFYYDQELGRVKVSA